MEPKKKLRMGFDFDGVVAEVDLKYAEFAENLDESNPTTQGIMEVVLLSPKWRDYTLNLKPAKDLCLLRTLCKFCEVHLISRRLESDRGVLEEWLDKNRISISGDHIHLRKELGDEVGHKRKWAAEMDHYFDDSLTLVEAIPNARLFSSWKNMYVYWQNLCKL